MDDQGVSGLHHQVLPPFPRNNRQHQPGYRAVSDYCLQSGKPAASGGVVELLVEGEPVAVGFVLVPLMLLLVLLPVLVLGVALRTCFLRA